MAIFLYNLHLFVLIQNYCLINKIFAFIPATVQCHKEIVVYIEIQLFNEKNFVEVYVAPV